MTDKRGPCTQCWWTVANHWQMSDFYSNTFLVMDWMWTKTIVVIDSLLYQLVVLLFESPLFCQVSQQQGEKLTRLTEILVHDVTFSIPNGAEFAAFAAFTMCLTFVWFPGVKSCQTFCFYRLYRLFSFYRSLCFEHLIAHLKFIYSKTHMIGWHREGCCNQFCSVLKCRKNF